MVPPSPTIIRNPTLSPTSILYRNKSSDHHHHLLENGSDNHQNNSREVMIGVLVVIVILAFVIPLFVERLRQRWFDHVHPPASTVRRMQQEESQARQDFVQKHLASVTLHMKPPPSSTTTTTTMPTPTPPSSTTTTPTPPPTQRPPPPPLEKKVPPEATATVGTSSSSSSPHGAAERGTEPRTNMCIICYNVLKHGDVISFSNNSSCPHWFHTRCISLWLNTHKDCPICRQEFLVNVAPHHPSTAKPQGHAASS